MPEKCLGLRTHAHMSCQIEQRSATPQNEVAYRYVSERELHGCDCLKRRVQYENHPLIRSRDSKLIHVAP
jgi:hypothetical protein